MDIIIFINQLALRQGDFPELFKWAQCKLHELLQAEEVDIEVKDKCSVRTQHTSASLKVEGYVESMRRK